MGMCPTLNRMCGCISLRGIRATLAGSRFASHVEVPSSAHWDTPRAPLLTGCRPHLFVRNYPRSTTLLDGSIPEVFTAHGEIAGRDLLLVHDASDGHRAVTEMQLHVAAPKLSCRITEMIFNHHLLAFVLGCFLILNDVVPNSDLVPFVGWGVVVGRDHINEELLHVPMKLRGEIMLQLE